MTENNSTQGNTNVLLSEWRFVYRVVLTQFFFFFSDFSRLFSPKEVCGQIKINPSYTKGLRNIILSN